MFRFAVTLLIVTLAFAISAWKVRPYLMANYPWLVTAHQRVAGFWLTAWTWLKVRWDIASAAVIAVAPIAWDSALDLIITVAQTVADSVPALAGLDLSNLTIGDTTKTYIQIGAVVLPVIRAAIVGRSAAALDRNVAKGEAAQVDPPAPAAGAQ